MIDIEFVLRIHKTLIQLFGGDSGIRDIGLLDAALKRPFQTFGETDLYVSIIDKSAALIQSLINNHPFIDGNKRTGYFILRWYLISNDFDFSASKDSIYEFIIQIASGKYDYDKIKAWLINYTKTL